MYTKEKIDAYDLGAQGIDSWNILDPDGDAIARVLSEDEANALLSHLNR